MEDNQGNDTKDEKTENVLVKDENENCEIDSTENNKDESLTEGKEGLDTLALESETRVDLIAQILNLSRENEELKKQNENLQHILSTTFFRPTKKKGLQEIQLPVESDEASYTAILGSINKISAKAMLFSELCQKESSLFKQTLQDKEKTIAESSKEFRELKKVVALNAVNSETGETFTKTQIESFLAKEEERYQALIELRLQSIREGYALDAAIEKKMSLTTAEGALNFAEFDMMVTQLESNKVKTPRVKKKVDELDEKCCNVVNAMSHMSQKLHFLHLEKSVASGEGEDMAKEVDQMRKKLFSEKVQYDRMRTENEKLQHRFVLLQYPHLIDDYKFSVKEHENALKKLRTIKEQYRKAMAIMSEKKPT